MATAVLTLIPDGADFARHCLPGQKLARRILPR